MRGFFVFLVGFIIFAYGCSKNQSIPENIMPEDSLVRVIVDMHIGDAIFMQPNIQSKPFVINKQKFYSAILKKHSLTKKDFQKNMNYFANNTEEFEHIYERVIEELTIIQGNLKVKDSLKTNSVH